MTDRVLFLDIDGVLNSTRTAAAFGGYPYEPEHQDRFDHAAIGLIRRLCSIASARIVLSSSWRKDRNWEQIGPALALPIIDRTPSLSGVRGDEIAAWLAAHPEVTEFAIVDDDSDMLDEHEPRFVKTNGHEGLLWADYSRLCAIFGVNPHDRAAASIGGGREG